MVRGMDKFVGEAALSKIFFPAMSVGDYTKQKKGVLLQELLESTLIGKKVLPEEPFPK